MNEIQRLIHEMCPDGVPMVAFDACATYTRGITYNKKQESDPEDSSANKILRANNITLEANSLNFNDIKFVKGEVKIRQDQWLKAGDILICAGSGSKEHIGKVAYIEKDIPFSFGGFMAVIRPQSNTISRYLFHNLVGRTFKDYLSSALNSTTINNLNSSVMNGYEIPLPPLPIQQRIVEILDKFTSLVSSLDSEIALRQKQYEYYRDKLYGDSIEELLKNEAEGNYSLKSISGLGTITRGKRFTREDVVENGVPALHYGDMYTYYGLSADKANTHLTAEKASKMRFCKTGDVVIVGAGENDWDIGVGVVWLGNEKAAVHDACYILEHNQNPMYISHFLRSNVYHLQLRKYVSDAKICSFSAKDLGRIIIPIPSLDHQLSIVRTLDLFESLLTNLKKERELRQKQYEYYREKLLTFA